MIGFDGTGHEDEGKGQIINVSLVFGLNSRLDSGGKVEKSKSFCIYVGFWVGAH